MKCLVVFVLLLITLAYSTYWVCVIAADPDGWYGPTGWLRILLVKSLLFLVLYNYYNAITTPAGYVPRGWRPDHVSAALLDDLRAAAAANDKDELERLGGKGHTQLRYCLKCEAFKPPRAHHCRMCDRCTLRMDHHCPWVNNCVGNNNHKFFVLFLCYAIFGISYALLSFGIKCLNAALAWNRGEPVDVTPVQAGLMFTNFMILGPVILGMTGLLFWQFSIIIENTTTVESHEKQFAVQEARRKRKRFVWPYDMGLPRNLRMFFGPHMGYWPLPVIPAEHGDGFSYPMQYVPNDASDDECSSETVKNKEDHATSPVDDDARVPITAEHAHSLSDLKSSSYRPENTYNV